MKVLIISHNPVSDQNNMGKTLSALFSEFPTQELCQLYIYPTIPNAVRVSSAYRITDKQILQSFFGKKPGAPINFSQIRADAPLFDNPGDERLYRAPRNKSPLRRLLRDKMWQLSRWYRADLISWLDSQQPDCIFVAPGQARFLYDIALKISHARNIPIVSYFCDDWYFLSQGRALQQVYRRTLQDKIRQLLAESRLLVTICPSMSRQYSAHFGICAQTLMTGGTAIAQEENPAEGIWYFGNVRCGRYRSLCDVAQALDAYNRAHGTAHCLHIHTAETDTSILGALRAAPTVRLGGFLTGNDYIRAFSRAKLVLHVESFDRADRQRVRHSISTKIADSLASGKVLLAYGPPEVASITHLVKNRCALTATNCDALAQMLAQAFADEAAQQNVSKNAKITAAAWHNTARNSQKLRKILKKVTENEDPADQ